MWAAAAQYTAEGAVVRAAGGAAMRCKWSKNELHVGQQWAAGGAAMSCKWSSNELQVEQ